MKFVRLIFFMVLSPRVQEEDGREKVVLIAVKTIPAGSKPLAAVGVRISTGERQGFGASAPLSTRASPTDVSGAGGLAIMPKLVKLVGPSLALSEELSPFFLRSAAPSAVRLRVSVSDSTSASVTRRGCQGSSSRLAKR